MYVVRGKEMNPFLALLGTGGISVVGENRKGIEKLYFPILKEISEKMGGASRVLAYFNEEKIGDIEGSALSEIQGTTTATVEPLRAATCEEPMRIDSRMPELLAAMEAERALTGVQDTKALLQAVAEKNPLNFPRPDFYEYKWKQYLLAAFAPLGGEPCGGYIVTAREGEKLIFHIYDREHFAEYLLTAPVQTPRDIIDLLC